MTHNTMKFTTTLVAATAAAVIGTSAFAQVSADDLKKLGTTLTPWGAEKAGNKDGTIPEYTGGLGEPPAGYVKNSGKVDDPYAADKPLFVIDSKNMAQYADKLTSGAQVLLKRWPTYQIHVYPTHRSMPAMSKEHAENTLKNAANPECKTVGEGTGVRGCWAGTPFPVPKTGYEVMWNYLLAERPPAYDMRQDNWLVDSAGSATMTAQVLSHIEFPYWESAATVKPYVGEGMYYQRFISTTLGPARDAGGKTMIWFPLDFDVETQRTWAYTTGQRRTRLAPELTYDTPAAQLGGALDYDEINGGFAGRMDRFDFKLVGKKELYVPYNTGKVFSVTPDKVLGKQFANPELVRWELHRVWVVEAVRKPGKRHIAAKRTFYVDEDSWNLLSAEAVDDSGATFRVVFDNTAPVYGAPGITNFASAGFFYDLTKGQYIAISLLDQKPGGFKIVPKMSNSQMTPEALAGSGVR